MPENAWTAAEAPAYASRQEACAAAVELEVTNVALYDRLLATGTLPDDVRQVFEHNRMASLDHHKPAFERCCRQGVGRRPARRPRTARGRRRLRTGVRAAAAAAGAVEARAKVRAAGGAAAAVPARPTRYSFGTSGIWIVIAPRTSPTSKPVPRSSG